MSEMLKLMAKGGVIGIANIIPGVSGGTMAVVLGIYERLIEAIGNFVTQPQKRREYIGFLAQIGIGAIVAVLVLSWLMDYLLSNHQAYTYMFFIGLIAGSVPSIFNAHHEMRPTLPALLAFLAGMALILAFAIAFPIDKEANPNVEIQLGAYGLTMLLISGILAGGSMIMPGISGSFILVLLGQYSVVIRAVKELNLPVLAIVGVGAVIGVWGFAKLIDYLLKRFPKQTIYFILGLVIGSLYPIFPGVPVGGGGVVAISAVLLIGAFLISYLLGKR